MNIALISPKGRFIEDDIKNRKMIETISNVSIYKNFHSGYSIALLTVAALTPNSFKIKLIDENFDSIDFNENFDLVGITGMTQQAVRAYKIADVFRKRGIKVVIGGIHATVMPEEAKQHADSVIIGEGEELWPEFLKDFLSNDIKPFYKTNHLADLSKSPIPRYDLLKRKNYNVAWVQTTRGCPIDCEFCVASKVYGPKFRHKKVEQVIGEIRYIIKLFGSGVFINFADDNMFIDRRYSIMLAKELIPLKIRWFAQTDISIGEDEDFLRLLRRSGCSVLFIGFETLNRKGLISLDSHNWKFKRFANYKNAIKKIQSYGIGIFGAFILGLDTDTPSIFKKTADFINNIHLFAAQITILTPLPGTRLRERLAKEGRLLNTGWDNYTFFKANYIPKRMSPKQLENGLSSVHSLIYNEKVILGTVKYFKKVFYRLLKKKI